MSVLGLRLAAAIPAAALASLIGAVGWIAMAIATGPDPVNGTMWLTATVMGPAVFIIAFPVVVIALVIVALPLTWVGAARVAATPWRRGIPLVLLGAALGWMLMAALQGTAPYLLEDGLRDAGLIFGSASAACWTVALRVIERLDA